MKIPQPPRLKLRESDIQSQIIETLKLYGRDVVVLRINTVGVFDPVKKIYRTPGKHQRKGTSDIIVSWRGRFLALEVKVPGKKATPEQEAFISDVRRSGGLACVVHSIEEVFSYLRYEGLL